MSSLCVLLISYLYYNTFWELNQIYVLFNTFISLASSFLIAIIVPLTSNALGSLDGLINTGVIFVPFTNPMSKSLLLVFPWHFNSCIIPLLFNGSWLKFTTSIFCRIINVTITVIYVLLYHKSRHLDSFLVLHFQRFVQL